MIGSTLGGVRPTTVERECACRRCDNPIPKGTQCYEISQLGGSFASYKRYCDDCFDSILKQTKTQLETLCVEFENRKTKPPN